MIKDKMNQMNGPSEVHHAMQVTMNLQSASSKRYLES